MLWIKIFHIFFIISWFSGIFYLPRLFVNLALLDKKSDTYQHLLGMSQRLYRFMTVIMLLAVVFGLLLLSNQWHYYLSQFWIHIKLFFVVLLLSYHGTCYYLLKKFSTYKNNKSHKFYRWFNEAPVLILFCIIILVVFKPG